MKRLKSILSVLLAVAMLLGSVPMVVFGTDGGKLQLTEVDPTFDPRLPELFVSDDEQTEPEFAPDDIVRVSIVLDDDAALEKGYPIKTIGTDKSAVKYRDKLYQAQNALTRRIENTVLGGKSLNVYANLTIVANLISADVKYCQIEKIEKIPGVKKVEIEQIYEPFKDIESSDSEAAALAKVLTEYTGAGSRIAIVDSGVNNEHQSFSDKALDYALRQSATDTDGDGVISDEELDAYKEELNFMLMSDVEEAVRSGKLHVTASNLNAEKLYLNSKIPFAYNYADNNLKVQNNEAGIHGSHVAGIAAANTYIPRDDTFVKAADVNAVVGTAPDAQILNLKVFGNSMCTDAVIATAIEDAIVLGADVLNLSLGTAKLGFACVDSVYGNVLDELTENGIIVIGAIGNDGSWIAQNGTWLGNGVEHDSGRPGKLYADDVNLSTTTPPSSYSDLIGVAWADVPGAGSFADMNKYSSYGIPSSLTLKPEITASGTNISSVDGGTTNGYTSLSGTSMAAPDVAGAAAVIAQYLRTKQPQFGDNTFLSRALAHNDKLNSGMIVSGLLMSAADPMRDSEGRYYSLLRQGAGLLNVEEAVSAKSFIEVEGQTLGRVKAEVGDCPDGTNTFTYKFTLNNVSDVERSYTFKTDLFTEDIVEENNIKYLADVTRALSGNITYEVNGTKLDLDARIEADVNGDGATDAADALALLDYLSGKRGGSGLDLDAADVDNDNKPTTYDAHLILKSLEFSAVSVPANGKATVKVTIVVTDDLKEDYKNGAYLEGFTYVVPVNMGEKEADIMHTIPILGFCGNWSDPSMFDRNSYIESVNGTNKTAPYTMKAGGVYEMNYMTYQDKSGATLKMTTNPYANSERVSLDKLALNLETVIYNINMTLIRPAGAMCFVAMSVDENGHRTLQYMDGLYLHSTCAYPHPTNIRGWNYASTSISVHSSLAKMMDEITINEGDKIEIGVVAVPEYYEEEIGTPITRSRMKELINNDLLGKGAFLTTTVTVDNTAPTVEGDPTVSNNAVNFKVTDNEHVAYIGLYSTNGEYIYGSYTPDENTDDKEISYSFNTKNIQSGAECALVVGDYAGNTRMYRFTWGSKPNINDGAIAYVRSYDGGGRSINRGCWLSLKPDRFVGASSWNTSDVYNLFPFAYTDSSVPLAGADAADDWLWQAFDDGMLYAAPLDNLNDRTPICDLDAFGMKTVRDLAFSAKDKMLYAVDGTDVLWQIDPMGGGVRAVQHVKTDDGEAASLYGLAVKNDGTVYSTSYDEENSKSKLLTWALPEVDGETTEASAESYDLEKINVRYVSLNWVDKNYSALYAACADSLDSPNSSKNYLYKITGTGSSYRVDKANDGIGAASCLYSAVRGFVYLPAMQNLGIMDEAEKTVSGLNICGASTEMLSGETAQLSVALAPWNVKADAAGVTWKSGSDSVATVSTNGFLKAVGEGKAKITTSYIADDGTTLSAEFEVNVKAAPSIEVAALVRENNGSYYWESFNTSDPKTRQKLSGSQRCYSAGTMNQEGDCLYLIGGLWGYRVDPATFAVESLESSIYQDYAHADAAPGLSHGNWTNFGYLTITGGKVLLLGGNLYGLSGFKSVSTNMQFRLDQLSGTAAGIAYKGYVDKYELHSDNSAPEGADVYYVMTEDGNLHMMAIYDHYRIHTELLGKVEGVNLPGVSRMQIDATSSMIYDKDTGYLVLISKIKMGTAKVQVIDPEKCEIIMTREFEDDVREVSVLYQYDYSDIKTTSENAADNVYTHAVEDVPGSEIKVDDEEKTVTVEFTVDGTTNGLTSLKYDPSVLTFSGASSTMQHYSVSGDETGTINIAFADAYSIENATVRVKFTYEAEKSEQTTELSFTEQEKGNPAEHVDLETWEESIVLPGKTVESIEISKMPEKTTYLEGEKFDQTGLEVKAWYSDGTFETLDPSEYSVSGYVSTPGKHTITVTYKDKTATFEIEVLAKSLKSISISKKPNKLEYIEGTTFDGAGMELTLHYDNGTTETVTDGWTAEYDFSNVGEAEVKIIYGDCSAVLKVNVIAKSLESITVSKDPTKMEYIEGTDFDGAGMELTLHYDNGTTETVTDGWTAVYDFSEVGEAEVKITYKGCSAILKVNVIAKSLSSISVGRNPVKMVYVEGTEFDDAGMELTLHYNNGTTETVTTGWTAKYDFSKVGKANVTITYQGFSTTLAVDVIAKSLASISIGKNPVKMAYIEGTQFDDTGMELTLHYNNGTTETVTTGWTVDYDFSKVGKAEVLISYQGFTTTLEVNVVAKSLESITVSKNPTKMEYIEGTEFDDTGMELTLHYDNGTTETVTAGWTVDYDFSKVGETSVQITYGECTTTLKVNVIAKSLTSISIGKNPTKMEYIEGTLFDDTGMELTLHYNNGTTETVTTGWTADYDFSEVGKTNVTITYQGFTTTLEVNVIAKSLVSISISMNPIKMVYIEGTQFDDTGMELTLHYNNGTTETVTDGWTSEYDFSNVGKAHVTITYKGFTTTLEVDVIAKSLASISVSKNPNKMEYIEGTEFDDTGMELTLLYNNGTTETVTTGWTTEYDFSKVGKANVTITYQGFTTTLEVNVVAKSLISISVSKNPNKMEYIEGTEFDDTGMELTLYYDNGTTETVTTGWTTEYDFSKVGKANVTITYQGFTTTLEVNVVAKSLISISVSKNPNKMEYIEGTEFDDTGMELTLYYDNGTTETVTTGWTTEYDFSKVGKANVTITYKGFTTTLGVNVIAKSLTSISVSKNPAKMEYIEGTQFDDTGMELTLHYNNGTTETVTDGWTTDYDFSKVGKTNVTITYKGFTTTLEVNVIAKSLVSISVSKNPNKMEYIEGTEFDDTGMELTLHYNNGTTETVMTGWTTDYDFSKVGKANVTITYQGFTTTLEVDVIAKSLVSISVSKNPNKMEYIEGTEFDDAGMELTLHYDNGTTETVTTGWTTEYDFSKVGKANVTITYKGFTTTLEVNVIAKSLTSISVSKNPTKMEYIEGTEFDDTGMELTLLYNNGTTETVTDGWTVDYDFSKVGKANVTITYQGFTTTLEVDVIAKSLTSISISKNPTKMEYIEGMEFDDTGMELTLYYDNGTTETVTDGWTAEYDFSNVGKAHVTITYKGFTTTLEVNVIAKSLVSISVSKNPTKMEYIEGTEFDDAGMELTLHYDNGTTEIVTTGWTTEYDFSKVGKANVTITYQGFTTTLEVNVVAKSLTSISISKNPTKMEYIEGTEFDDAGMELTLLYDNGTTETVTTGWEIGEYDFSTHGKTEITVNYGGFTVTLEVTVLAKGIERIEITRRPDKTEYVEGTEFDPKGIEITVYYNNGMTEILTDGMEFAYNFDVAGESEVTVSYQGYDAVLTVNVIAKTLTRIEITKMPEKTEYTENGEFDGSGMEITLYYDNGTTETVTEGWTAEYDFSVSGQREVKVSYGGVETGFTVTVKAASHQPVKPGEDDEKVDCPQTGDDDLSFVLMLVMLSLCGMLALIVSRKKAGLTKTRKN